MQGYKRKVVYVTLYEIIAIIITTISLSLLSNQGAAHTSIVAIASTSIAIIWNLLYNTAFEFWESKQTGGRTFFRRILHAVGFEVGLVFMLVPMFAWWLNISLIKALVMDIGLIIFFLIYTFVYNLIFDKVFGLPTSALPPKKTLSSKAL